jgi:hypothetical protein
VPLSAAGAAVGATDAGPTQSTTVQDAGPGHNKSNGPRGAFHEMRGRVGNRRPGVGGGRDGSLHMAVSVNGRSTVRVLGLVSMRTGGVGRRLASSRVRGKGGWEDPGVRSPGVGCGRDGRQRMTALGNIRATVRLLCSVLQCGDVVVSRGASSHADLFWAKCSAQGVASIAPVCRDGTSDSKTLSEYSRDPYAMEGAAWCVRVWCLITWPLGNCWVCV